MNLLRMLDYEIERLVASINAFGFWVLWFFIFIGMVISALGLVVLAPLAFTITEPMKSIPGFMLASCYFLFCVYLLSKLIGEP